MSFRFFSIFVIFLSFLVSALLYANLPSEISVHWDLNSNPNGSMSKLMGAFFIPLLMSAIFLLLNYLPKLDPVSKNFASFNFDYFLLVFVILSFLLYLHLMVLLWNLGFQFNFIQILSPAFFLLFFILGVFLPKIKRNFFIGIRTPWTLTSDEIWNKTHAFASSLFIFSSPICLVALVFPNFLLLIAPPILSSIVCVVYSYLVYRKSIKP